MLIFRVKCPALSRLYCLSWGSYVNPCELYVHGINGRASASVLLFAEMLIKTPGGAGGVCLRSTISTFSIVQPAGPKLLFVSRIAHKSTEILKFETLPTTMNFTPKLERRLPVLWALTLTNLAVHFRCSKNPDSQEETKKAVWASYYHYISTDENPQHSHCSIAWCKYLQYTAENTEEIHTHPPAFDEKTAKFLKLIYEELSPDDLIQRALEMYFDQFPSDVYTQCRTDHVVEVTFAGRAPACAGSDHAYPQVYDLHVI
ncbi:hypothetical protein EVAR_8096_1 [Eumeta japonica]|uniref:Uncharacterized protein n=1 Tax=Eumeta variegata TaxID=151549 RepID=A0A4C1TSP9_EUMVA|nr:hypothetical protein EVAR_8096_1 [Eumeta japonica]